MGMPVIYVPGYRIRFRHNRHSALFAALQALRLSPDHAELDWGPSSSIQEWVRVVAEHCDELDQPYVLMGFSIGAMTALGAAVEMTSRGKPPAALVLISLSGFFAEDLELRALDERGAFWRDRGFDEYPFRGLITEVCVPTIMVRGSEEVPSIVASSRRAARTLKVAEIVVPGIAHEEYKPEMAEYVREALKQLLGLGRVRTNRRGHRHRRRNT